MDIMCYITFFVFRKMMDCYNCVDLHLFYSSFYKYTQPGLDTEHIYLAFI